MIRGGRAAVVALLLTGAAPAAAQTSPGYQTWTQQGPAFTVPSEGNVDGLGRSVGLSGDTAVVGAPPWVGSAKSYPGAAWVYVRSGAVWQGPTLLDTGAPGSDYGDSVAIDGDTIVVGDNRGGAFVYVRNGSAWSKQGPALEPSDGAGNFGVPSAIAGNTIAVVAHHAAVVNGPVRGSIYVFVRSGSTWTQQGLPLTPADGTTAQNYFSCLTISGDTIVIGAQHFGDGSDPARDEAYVFTRSGATWVQQGPRLLPPDSMLHDEFGGSCSLSGNTLIIGAPNAAGGGAAYVFVRSAGVWSFQAELVSSDRKYGDRFGSVQLSDNTALVGAPMRTTGAQTAQGAAYVFSRRGTVWTQQGPALVASDGKANDYAGQVLGLSGNTALIGGGYLLAPHGSVHAFVGHCVIDTDCADGASCSTDGVCQTVVVPPDGAAGTGGTMSAGTGGTMSAGTGGSGDGTPSAGDNGVAGGGSSGDAGSSHDGGAPTNNGGSAPDGGAAASDAGSSAQGGSTSESGATSGDVGDSPADAGNQPGSGTCSCNLARARHSAASAGGALAALLLGALIARRRRQLS